MKYRAKKDIEFSKDSGFEDYGAIPKGTVCEVMIFERSPAIFYSGKAVCDPDSKMAEECFREVAE